MLRATGGPAAHYHSCADRRRCSLRPVRPQRHRTAQARGRALSAIWRLTLCWVVTRAPLLVVRRLLWPTRRAAFYLSIDSQRTGDRMYNCLLYSTCLALLDCGEGLSIQPKNSHESDKQEAADGRCVASTDVNFRIVSLASALTLRQGSSSSKLQAERLCSIIEFVGCVPDSNTKRTMPELHMSAAAPS